MPHWWSVWHPPGPHGQRHLPALRQDKMEVDDPELLLEAPMDETISQSAEQGDTAWSTLADLAAKGFLQIFDSAQDISEHLGRDPVISKMHVITKVFHDRVKKRIILDVKASGVSGASSKTERVFLPRALDVVWDTMDLLSLREHPKS